MSIELAIDDYGMEEVLEIVDQYRPAGLDFIVTPNVDHLIRVHDDPQFRSLYAAATMVLMDSRFLANILALVRGQSPRVCRGSELTQRILSGVAKPDDRIVLVGARSSQVESLRRRFGFTNLVHVEPAMGFIRDPQQVQACLREVEAASPFRFCFLAVGSPQQEIVAYQLKTRAVARGLALCVGASIDFLTGAERRAPAWMQRLGFEWLFRLMVDPRRMARRYLLRGPRIFALLPRIRFVLRRELFARPTGQIP